MSGDILKVTGTLQPTSTSDRREGLSFIYLILHNNFHTNFTSVSCQSINVFKIVLQCRQKHQNPTIHTYIQGI